MIKICSNYQSRSLSQGLFFMCVPLIWHRYGEHKPFMKVDFLTVECCLTTTDIFSILFLWHFCRVCVFLQPIKSMTFERIRSCCSMVPQWSLDSSLLKLNTFGIEINAFKPNVLTAKLKFCPSFYLLPPRSLLHHTCASDLESAGWWQHE